MAKNSIDAYGAQGKTNVLLFDPDALTLVIDPSHPLYDRRVHNAPTEEMVLNIMAFGVGQPITVTKDTETGETQVVAGRQRVINAREANRRLRETGRQPISIPGVIRRGKGVELAGFMASENALRTQETVMQRAEKMAHLANLGASPDAIAIAFGCTARTVEATMALLDCSRAVREAVESGLITTAHARELSKMAPAESQARLAEMIVAAGNGARPHARARAQRALMGEMARRIRTKAEIIRRREEFGANTPERAILDWVLGATDA